MVRGDSAGKCNNLIKPRQSGELYLAKNISEQVFISLESDRGKLAEALRDDICQLIAIAKMRVSGDTATEVNTYLTKALNKLCLLAFELKPLVLEHFGLSTALEGLLNHRRKADVGYGLFTLKQLPEGIDSLKETAVFRLAQQILNSLPSPDYQNFGLKIARTGHFICLKITFEINNLTDGLLSVNLVKESLIKAIQPTMHCFYGHHYFKLLTDNYAEFTVCLDEETEP